MVNRLRGEEDVTAQGRRLEVVTPSDSTDLSVLFGAEVRALIICGAGGALAVQGVDNAAAVTLPGLSGGGQVLPIRVTRVMATGTTIAAGSILAVL